MNSNLWDFSGDGHQRGLMKAVFWEEKSYLKLFAPGSKSFIILFIIKRSEFWQVGKKRQELWLCPGAEEHRFLPLEYLKHLLMYPSTSETKNHFLPYKYYFLLALPQFYIVLQ